jgi:hypothetical protein
VKSKSAEATTTWPPEMIIQDERCFETDDIERIRYLRNFLTHNSKFEICDTDFSTHWTDLSQVK